MERDVGAMAGDDFHPTFLRNATAFGASPRMRFDIVLNNLMGVAWTTRRGANDVRRLALATARPHPRHSAVVGEVLAAPAEAIHGQILNVGSDEQNYRVREIAEIVAAAVPGCTTHFGPRERRQPELPGQLREDRSRCSRRSHARGMPRPARPSSPRSSARIGLDEELFTSRGFTRLDQLQPPAHDRPARRAAPLAGARSGDRRHVVGAGSGREPDEVHRDAPAVGRSSSISNGARTIEDSSRGCSARTSSRNTA